MRVAVVAAFIIGLLGILGAVVAQDTTSASSQKKTDIRTWFGSKSGGTTSGNPTGVVSLNHVRSSHVFGVRYLWTTGTNAWTGTGWLGELRYEIGLLYGRPVTWDWGHASLESGLAVVWGEPLTSESASRTTVGIPFQANLYVTIPYRPVDSIGLQVGGHPTSIRNTLLVARPSDS